MASADCSSVDTVQCSAYGGKYLSDADDGNDFTFVDFLPEIRDHVKKIYENFRMLVERANDFLRSDRKWRIVNCESINFNLPDGNLDHTKMVDKYKNYMGETRIFQRGLRLWLKERHDPHEKEEQIGYVNIIPQQLEEEGVPDGSKYETLEMVIERANTMLQSQPLPGRILTIETQGMKSDISQKFDADVTNWVEYWTEAQSEERHVFVLRIFYRTTSGTSDEIIGVKDFVPERLREGTGLFGKDEYESFTDVANKAWEWRAQQNDLRICNLQTLEMRHITAGEVNTEKMIYLKAACELHFVRVLRVAYAKPFPDAPVNPNPSPVKQLSFKTFIPQQLSKGTCVVEEYENLATTKERISAWVKATGVDVLNAETKTYLIKRTDTVNKGSEICFANKGILRWHSWMYVVRLYIEGNYEEPPPQMLPPVRMPEEKYCCEVS